jgi:hypothetical protein
MNIVTGREELTLVDIADRLLDTGVVLDGEATISVADVDLIWLGLNVALTSFDRVREKQASGALARNVPSGPGTMSASLYSEEVAELKAGVERLRAVPERVNVDPDDVEKGLAKLVLTIVEFIRQLLERQAVRRMERGTLTEEEVERVGLALERLDRKLTEMAARFGLAREELRLGLGPLGELV